MKKKNIGTSFDNFLKEQGMYESNKRTSQSIPISSEYTDCMGYDEDGRCLRDDLFCQGKCNYFKAKGTRKESKQ